MSKTLNRDLALDSNTGELLIVNGDLVLTDETNNTAQAIKLRLAMFEGEWYLDTALGIPYFDDILDKGKFLSDIKTIYLREIQSIPEVAEILEFNIEEDVLSRTLKINFTIRDKNGYVIEIEI
jgi:hypothetical protein